MRKLTLVAILAALAVIAPMTGQALTRVASCTATPTTPCTTTFVCPPHTVNLRAIPASFQFIGTVEVSLDDGTTVASQTSEWTTGRIQTDGPEFTTVLPDAFQTCTLTVTVTPHSILDPLSNGNATGIVEA